MGSFHASNASHGIGVGSLGPFWCDVGSVGFLMLLWVIFGSLLACCRIFGFLHGATGGSCGPSWHNVGSLGFFCFPCWDFGSPCDSLCGEARVGHWFSIGTNGQGRGNFPHLH